MLWDHKTPNEEVSLCSLQEWLSAWQVVFGCYNSVKIVILKNATDVGGTEVWWLVLLTHSGKTSGWSLSFAGLCVRSSMLFLCLFSGPLAFSHSLKNRMLCQGGIQNWSIQWVVCLVYPCVVLWWTANLSTVHPASHQVTTRWVCLHLHNLEKDKADLKNEWIKFSMNC